MARSANALREKTRLSHRNNIYVKSSLLVDDANESSTEDGIPLGGGDLLFNGSEGLGRWGLEDLVGEEGAIAVAKKSEES
jgi:hypothetical protein